MSNPWAKSFEELRAPYLAEKKAKKDYDGDGKIESGTDEYMGSKDKAIKKAMAERGKKKVAEHHQKDADGNTVPHEDEGAGTPSSVEEAKIDTIDPKNKRKRRNERQFGKQTKPYDPDTKEMKTSMGKFMNSMRHDMHNKKRGVKTKGMKKEENIPTVTEALPLVPTLMKAGGIIAGHELLKIVDRKFKEKKLNNLKKEEIVLEADKKGKGSGTKDACYKKVKASAKVWPSAYASGRLVQCRKKGAANYGNSKKEEFDFRIKSFDDMVGECWKTHKKVGMKMKGGKMVPDCRPKNEGVEEAVKHPKLDIKETGVKNKIEINPEIKTEAAKAPVKK